MFFFVFFVKQKTAYEIASCLVGSEMCIRDRSRPTENTPRKPQQPGDRDHLETACDETRPTR